MINKDKPGVTLVGGSVLLKGTLLALLKDKPGVTLVGGSVLLHVTLLALLR